MLHACYLFHYHHRHHHHHHHHHHHLYTDMVKHLIKQIYQSRYSALNKEKNLLRQIVRTKVILIRHLCNDSNILVDALKLYPIRVLNGVED